MTVNSIWNLIDSKDPGYQFRDHELMEAGYGPEQLDHVRHAISRARSFSQTPPARILKRLLEWLGNLINVSLAALIGAAAFLACLQMPYVHEQANAELDRKVSVETKEYQVASEIADETRALYQRHDLEDETLPKSLRKRLEKAERWMAYRGRDVRSLWGQALTDRQTFSDLRLIYDRTFEDYRLGFPEERGVYLQALGVGILALAAYLLVAAGISRTLEGYIEKAILLQELPKPSWSEARQS